MTVESPNYTAQRLFRPGGLTTIAAGAVVKLNGSTVSADQDLFEGKTLEIYSSRKITDVALTGVTRPVEDEVPDCTIDPVPDDALYTISENGIWWNDVEADQYPMTDATFINHVYCISVKLVAKDGYVFPTKSADYNTFTIDGRKASIYNADPKGKWIEVTSDTYIPIKNDVIPSVNITVGDFYDYQSSGPEIDYNDKGTGAARFYLKNTYWYDWARKAVSEDRLSKAGWTYDGTLEFKPYGERKFTSDTVVTVDGDVTVNGVLVLDEGKTLHVLVSTVAKAHTCTPAAEWSTDEDYHWHACSICGKEMSDSKVEHDYPIPEGTEGQTVTVTCSVCGAQEDVTIPGTSITSFLAKVRTDVTLGKTLPENSVWIDYFYEARGTELYSYEWRSNSNGTVLNEGETFTDPGGYTLTVVFKARDGFYFDDYIKKVNTLNTIVDQTNTLSDDNKTLTAVCNYTGKHVGKGYDFKVTLPTLAPETDFNDYDYSEMFKYYYNDTLTHTGGQKPYTSFTDEGVERIFILGAYIWVDSDGDESCDSSETIPETGEVILRWNGTEWEDVNPNDSYDTTIQKGVVYRCRFDNNFDLSYTEYASKILSTEIDGGNAIECSAWYRVIYYFANDDEIEYVNLTVDAPKSGETPDTTASAPSGAGYSGGTPVWTKGGVAVTGNFTEGTYTVTIPLILDEGKSLAEDCIFAINGMQATYADGKLSLTFPSIGSIGVTVSGTVTSFNSDTDEVILQFIREGMSEAEYEATVYGNSTTYSLTGVLPGTYTVKVMKKNHVTREYTVTVGSENVTQDVRICPLGDVNLDGSVNLADVRNMISAIAGGTQSEMDEYSRRCADVTEDNNIALDDVRRLISAIASGEQIGL